MAWCPHCNLDRPIQRHTFNDKCAHCDATPDKAHHPRCRGAVPGAIDVCTFCNNPLFRLATDEASFNQLAMAESETCVDCNTPIHHLTAAWMQ